MQLGGGFQHAQALRHDFLADAVAGDDGDTIFFLSAHDGFLRARKTIAQHVDQTRPAINAAVHC
jgi:hypothetical protein